MAQPQSRRKAIVVVNQQNEQEAREAREALNAITQREHIIDSGTPKANRPVSNRVQIEETVANRSRWFSPVLDGSFLNSDWFNLFMGFVVICNAIEIGVQTDDLDKERIIYSVLDNSFLILYISELTLRLYFTRWQFFATKFNIFDLFLVFMAVLDTWLLSSSGLRSLTVLRVLRMMRLARLVKLLRFSRELWLIVTMLRSSLRTLLWVSIILLSFLWINAIFLTLVLGKSEAWIFAKRETADLYEYFDVSEYFGKVWRSFFSLFQLCTLDHCMSSIVRPVSAVYGTTLVYFVFIIFACTLGLLNVMTAIVCRDALLTAKDNEKKQKLKEELERKKNIVLLRQVLKSLDIDRDGQLSNREFKLLLQADSDIAVVEGYTVHQILKKLDVTVDDVLTLYRLVDKENVGQVLAEDLIKAIVKFRGESRSQDVVKLVVQVQALLFKCGHVDGRLETLLSKTASLRTTYNQSIFQGIRAANLPTLVSSAQPSQRSDAGISGAAKTEKKGGFKPAFALPGSIDFAKIERAGNLPASVPRRAGDDRSSEQQEDGRASSSGHSSDA